MLAMDGLVTIVQEGRFQLLDDAGVGHHFLLRHSAALEPEQLPSLLMHRVHVRYDEVPGIIGNVAVAVLLPGSR
jgi:hypothetical protein